jgi:hypothetical protein
MSTRKMHIAKSGKQAGQWVSCTAQGMCRNGGTHITDDELKKVKKWSGKKAVADLTIQDHVNYLKEYLNPSKIFEDRMTPDEVDQAYTRLDPHNGKVEQSVDLSFGKNQWMDFLQKSFIYGVDIPLDTVKKGGASFREGNRTLNLKGVQLNGKEESVKKLLAEFSLS